MTEVEKRIYFFKRSKISHQVQWSWMSFFIEVEEDRFFVCGSCTFNTHLTFLLSCYFLTSLRLRKLRIETFFFINYFDIFQRPINEKYLTFPALFGLNLCNSQELSCSLSTKTCIVKKNFIFLPGFFKFWTLKFFILLTNLNQNDSTMRDELINLL